MKFFDLRDFDVSCREPVQMLSVQTPLSGDVFPFFQDVTYEAASDHFRHFLESWHVRNPMPGEKENENGDYKGFPGKGRILTALTAFWFDEPHGEGGAKSSNWER